MLCQGTADRARDVLPGGVSVSQVARRAIAPGVQAAILLFIRMPIRLVHSDSR